MKFIKNNNKIKEIEDQIIIYDNEIIEIQKKVNDLIHKVELESEIQPGNLIKAKDISTNEESFYVCYCVKASCDIFNHIDIFLLFLKMRKNSENSFTKNSYSDSDLKDIKLIDNSKNYLINDQKYNFDIF